VPVGFLFTNPSLKTRHVVFFPGPIEDLRAGAPCLPPISNRGTADCRPLSERILERLDRPKSCNQVAGSMLDDMNWSVPIGDPCHGSTADGSISLGRGGRPCPKALKVLGRRIRGSDLPASKFPSRNSVPGWFGRENEPCDIRIDWDPRGHPTSCLFPGRSGRPKCFCSLDLNSRTGVHWERRPPGSRVGIDRWGKASPRRNRFRIRCQNVEAGQGAIAPNFPRSFEMGRSRGTRPLGIHRVRGQPPVHSWQISRILVFPPSDAFSDMPGPVGRPGLVPKFHRPRSRSGTFSGTLGGRPALFEGESRRSRGGRRDIHCSRMEDELFARYHDASLQPSEPGHPTPSKHTGSPGRRANESGEYSPLS